MQNYEVIAGIDVSKAILDYALLPGEQAGQAENSSKGILKLIKNLKKIPSVLVVLEATGGYQDHLVETLHKSDIAVKVVNPRHVRDFARSLGRLAKTDKLDAKTLAEFGQSRDLQAQRPKSPEQRELSDLLTRRSQLQLIITAEKNHLEHARGAIATGIRESLSLMGKLLRNIELSIREIIQISPALAAQDNIVQSIPGVGPVVSTSLLAELPELSEVGRKQAAALVGVAPFNRDSGKYRGQRHIHAGRTKVRGAMYCAMRSCLRYNPVVRGWFDKFIAAGKPYKVAVIACVRKLLIVIRAMLRNKTVWNPKPVAGA